MPGVFEWLGNPYLRTTLILVLVVTDTYLVVRVTQMSRRQDRSGATIRALKAEQQTAQTLMNRQQEAFEQQLRLLAEITGHVEVAFDRPRLSSSSLELVKRGRGGAPGVDPAGERIPEGNRRPAGW